MVSPFPIIARELNKRLNLPYARYRLFHENRAMNGFLAAHPIDVNTEKELKFSVVVPTYAIPIDYVKEFVSSIWRQSYKSWELCVCDDGDPDPTVRRYFEKLSERFPEKIKFVASPKNEGICGATLKAFALATGDYVVLADADDTLHRRALELALTVARAKPHVDFMYSDHDYMTEWSYRMHPMQKPGWSPELLYHINYINHLKIIRRDLAAEVFVEAFDSRYNGSQDWNLCFQILRKATAVSHIPFVLYHWRARKGSMAEDVYAKPWAVEAQARLRRDFTLKYLGDLQFDPTSNHFKKDILPEVYSVFLPTMERVDSIERQLKIIRDEISSAPASAEVVFFEEETSLAHLEKQKIAVCCLLPNVGGVWPFQAEGLRTAYTINVGDDGHSFATPILPGRSSYSHYSGNILGGPLANMCFKKNNLLEVIDSLLAQSLPELFSGNILDVIGLLISIEGLSNGKRNFSCNLAFSDARPTQVTLPTEFLPDSDPYI